MPRVSKKKLAARLAYKTHLDRRHNAENTKKVLNEVLALFALSEHNVVQQVAKFVLNAEPIDRRSAVVELLYGFCDDDDDAQDQNEPQPLPQVLST